MTDAEDRILPLDLMRGAAILGVVLMNVVAIAMPRAFTAAPALAGGGIVDQIVWLAEFVLFDGKARALLAMLFGASALLVIDRAEMDGRDGIAVQQRRLLWLLPIGLFHHVLLWEGDILMLLAIGGLISLRFVAGEPLELLKAAFLFFGAQLLLVILVAAMTYTGTDASSYGALLEREVVRDIAAHRDSYGALLFHRAMDFPNETGLMALHALAETLGFMMLGMAMAKGGFFSGQWAAEQYRRTARHAYIVGIPALIALGLWALTGGDPRTADMIGYAAAFPFRIPVTIGHAALLAIAAKRFGRSGLTARVAAIGRAALSNYLLCTLIVTTLAYGYGAGLYARMDRVELLVLAIIVMTGMLLWSPLWLARYGRAPAERLWHKLQRVGTRAS